MATISKSFDVEVWQAVIRALEGNAQGSDREKVATFTASTKFSIKTAKGEKRVRILEVGALWNR